MPNSNDLFFAAFDELLTESGIPAPVMMPQKKQRGVRKNSTVKESAPVLSAEDYLSRGTRLFTLTRERHERETASFTFTALEEALFQEKMKGSQELTSDLAKSVIRPIFRKAENEDDAMIQALLAEINGIGKWNIELSYLERDDEEVRNFSRYTRGFQPGERVLRFILREEGYPGLTVYSRSREAEPKSRKNLLFKTGLCWCDGAYFLAHLLIVSMAVRELRKIRTMSEEEQEESILALKARGLVECAKKSIEHNYGDPEAFKKIPVFMMENTPKVLMNYFKDLHQGNPSMFTIEKNGRTCHEKAHEFHGYPVSVGGTTQALLEALFMELLEDFAWHDLLSNARDQKEHCWAIPVWWSGYYVFEKVFAAYLGVQCDKLRTVKYMRELNNGYAKSFQQKKNIPEKLLKAMETSPFNDNFGYVEFDELVDLEKVQVITDQFVAFKDRFFPGLDISQNSIRFRRLGNHKAAGLYYPFYKCLCVDVHSPDSFIHEFGHLIDNSEGWLNQLSQRVDFLTIRERYSMLLERKKNELNLKGKYNLSYYLEPTEIFARSFEVYMAKIRGVDCSLLPQEFGPVYPVDDEPFLALIKVYFDRLLKRFEVVEKEDAA